MFFESKIVRQSVLVVHNLTTIIVLCDHWLQSQRPQNSSYIRGLLAKKAFLWQA